MSKNISPKIPRSRNAKFDTKIKHRIIFTYYFVFLNTLLFILMQFDNGWYKLKHFFQNCYARNLLKSFYDQSSVIIRGTRRHLNEIENSNWATLVCLADPQDWNSLAYLPTQSSQHLAVSRATRACPFGRYDGWLLWALILEYSRFKVLQYLLARPAVNKSLRNSSERKKLGITYHTSLCVWVAMLRSRGRQMNAAQIHSKRAWCASATLRRQL